MRKIRILINFTHLLFLFGAISGAVFVAYTMSTAETGSSGTFILLASVLTSLVFGGLFAASFELRSKIILLSASFVFSLFLADLGLIVIFEDSKPKREIRTNTFETVHDLRLQGINAYPTTYPNMFYKNSIAAKNGRRLAPIGTISGVTSVFCNETGTHLIFKSDRFGFHNEDRVWDAPVIDIALIGDSFAHGACIPTEHNITSRVAKKTGKVALNLGAGGGGPLVYLAAIREYLRGRNVKKIVWAHFEGNDLRNLSDEFKSSIYSKYANPDFSQNLVNQQKDIDKGLKRLIKSAYEKRSRSIENSPPEKKAKPSKPNPSGSTPRYLVDILLLQTLRSKLTNLFQTDWMALKPLQEAGKGLRANSYTPKNYAQFETVFAKGIAEAKKLGSKIVLLYLHGNESIIFRNYENKEFKAIKAIAEKYNVPFISTETEFANVFRRRSLLGGGYGPHYSEFGYGIVADKLIENLD